MLNRNIKPATALFIVAATIATAGVAVNHKADLATAVPKTTWGDQKCLSCHSDAKTLSLMKDKKDDTTFCNEAYKKILTEQISNRSSTPKAWSSADPKKKF